MARLRRKKTELFETDIMELLNLTPMMDVFTVLVVFLLITAVFTSITIMDLSVPTSAGGAASTAELCHRGDCPQGRTGNCQREVRGGRHSQ